MDNSLTYDKLYQYWLEANQAQRPQGQAPIQYEQGDPRAYYMTPENMMAVLNSSTPEDLYNRPDYTPRPLDYGTSAFNISNLPRDVGIQNAILLASQNPQRQLSPIYSQSDNVKYNYSDISMLLKSLTGNAVYQHELAHYNDPRLRPEANNYGYITRQGMPGNIAAREIPAMRAEDRFWDKRFNQ